MTENEIVLKVNEVMHQGFEIPMEKLTPTATIFQDLDLDSLDAVDMLVHLESKFGMKVEGERLKTVRTMEDIYRLVSDVADVADVAGKSKNQSQRDH